MVSHASVVEMKELFARIILGRFGSLDSSATIPIGNSDQVSDSAVEGNIQDPKQSISSVKRRHDICPVDQDNTSVADQNHNDHKLKRPKLDSSTRQNIVCPYMKHDPVKYSKRRTCPGPGFDGISRLKEHLKRGHFKEFCCARCGQQFGTSANLLEHNRAPTACEVTDGWQHAGIMTQLQWDIIRRRRGHGTTEVERWTGIYRILFPDVDVGQIPSPYHEVPEAIRRPDRRIDYDEYEVYLRQNLPQRFMAQLSLEFQGLDEGHRQRMAEIVEEQSAEILAAFLRDQAVTQHTEELPKTGSAQDALVQDEFSWDFLNTADAVHIDPLGEWTYTNQ